MRSNTLQTLLEQCPLLSYELGEVMELRRQAIKTLDGTSSNTHSQIR